MTSDLFLPCLRELDTYLYPGDAVVSDSYMTSTHIGFREQHVLYDGRNPQPQHLRRSFDNRPSPCRAIQRREQLRARQWGRHTPRKDRLRTIQRIYRPPPRVSVSPNLGLQDVGTSRVSLISSFLLWPYYVLIQLCCLRHAWAF